VRRKISFCKWKLRREARKSPPQAYCPQGKTNLAFRQSRPQGKSQAQGYSSLTNADKLPNCAIVRLLAMQIGAPDMR